MNKADLAYDHISDPNDIKELSVVMYADSFFYGLWDSKGALRKVGYHPLYNYPQVKQLWEFYYNLDRTQYLVATPPYVHLDESDFEEASFDAYFKGIYDLDRVTDHGRRHDTFEFEQIMTLYFTELSSTIPIQHISTAMADTTHASKGLSCLMTEDKLHLSLTTDAGFRMYNQYHCAHPLDSIYFFQWVFQSFDLDAATAEFSVACAGVGMVEVVQDALERYFPKVKIQGNHLNLPESVTYAPSAYYDLHLCRLCAS